MATRPTTSSRDQILAGFQQVLAKHKALESKIVTKEEAAEQARDREVVKNASGYTVETIVKGLAELQLQFGGTVDSLAKRLTDEATRLEELRRAIAVETEHAKHLNDIKVAADALNVLKQEHRDSLKAFEEQARQRAEALEAEVRRAREAWQEEQKKHEATARKTEEQLQKDRKKAEEEFGYELARKRKVDADAFEEKKRRVAREVTEEDARKAKLWTEREAAGAARAGELKGYQAKLDAFPAELEDAVKKARDESLREAAADAKVRAELLEKEVEANRKVYALQIASLEETLKKQEDKIEALTTQLQAALRQTQDLAFKAVEGTAHTHAAARRGDGASA